MAPIIQITNLKKSFGQKHVTKDLSLEVEQGEFVAIIGKSGEGKSVLLKQIVGLITPDSGTVMLDGINVCSLKGQEKGIVYDTCGYVFQFAALLDSLTVFENVALAQLEHSWRQTDGLKKIVIEKLEAVGLAADVMDKVPSELSGGMRKRVGLARTLMKQPKIILYDEPTTGLDPISTRLIHELILKTHKNNKATTVVISHDVGIFEYADSVAMLFDGKIIYKGPAKEIWDCKNEYVWQFIRGLAEGPIKI